MAKFTKRKRAGKVGKPRPDFPLFPHASGRWAKKVRQKLHYFGKVADDPQGEAALNKWLDQKDDLLAGRVPRPKSDALTVCDLCNRFLSHKKSLLEAGEITKRTFGEYYATCERLCRVFGKDRPVDDLVADDFQAVRRDITRSWGPIRLANEIGRVKGVFKFGYEAGLLDSLPRYGPRFKKPSAKVLRKVRAAKGLCMFEREELLALLDVTPPIQKAMVLLAINGGLGNNDVAALPMGALNLKTGWLTYPRPKTGVDRRIPLWPETIAAVKAVLADRHEPNNPAHNELVFISTRGESYISENSGHRIAKTIVWFMEKAKIRRPGLTFYALRHTFQTVAEGARDISAVQAIMGRAASETHMSARYRERADDERLVAVVNYVHTWLFGVEETK